MPQKEAPHPLADLLLTIVLPSIVLETLSKPERLGPAWALIVALLLPLGFGIYCWVQKRGLNFFSVFGLIAILVTGGLGLLNLSAAWFAAKEAAFPLFMALAFPLSQMFGSPLVTELLLNPQFFDRTALDAALTSSEQKNAFQQLLGRASWAFAATLIVSALANTWLVLHYLKGTEPGTAAYTEAIGRQNWVGFLVIGLPMLIVTLILFLRFLKRIESITQLPRHLLLYHSRSSSSPK